MKYFRATVNIIYHQVEVIMVSGPRLSQLSDGRPWPWPVLLISPGVLTPGLTCPAAQIFQHLYLKQFPSGKPFHPQSLHLLSWREQGRARISFTYSILVSLHLTQLHHGLGNFITSWSWHLSFVSQFISNSIINPLYVQVQTNYNKQRLKSKRVNASYEIQAMSELKFCVKLKFWKSFPITSWFCQRLDRDEVHYF